MTASVEAIYKAALGLSTAERTELIEFLLSSLDTTSREEIDALWMKEVENRLAIYERGETYTISSEEVFAEIKKIQNENS